MCEREVRLEIVCAQGKCDLEVLIAKDRFFLAEDLVGERRVEGVYGLVLL